MGQTALNVSHLRGWIRWVILAGIVVVSAVALRPWVASNAEAFWCLFPVWLITATYGLKLFAFPRFPQQNRIARVALISVMITFPILFYGLFVRLTNSLWSWSELLLCEYFFCVSLECVLLIFFAAAASLDRAIQQRVPPRWHIVALIAQKVALYSILIPFLLVVFAVHRPKLLPRPLDSSDARVVEEISFPARDGLRLRGIFLPVPNSLGTVIICHGVGANHADIQQLFLRLYAAGFQILAFDFRGHGNSSGHTITYGLQERLDVLDAYEYCLTRKDVLPDKLFALGVSMGGASLLQALPDMPEVRAAVVDSAFSSLEGMADQQLRMFPSPLRIPMVQLVRGFAWIETGADLRDLAPATRLREIQIPLLIIHGGSDVIVPVSHAHELHAAAAGRAKLVIEPDAPHIGSVLIDPASYVQRVKQHFLAAVK